MYIYIGKYILINGGYEMEAATPLVERKSDVKLYPFNF